MAEPIKQPEIGEFRPEENRYDTEGDIGRAWRGDTPLPKQSRRGVISFAVGIAGAVYLFLLHSGIQAYVFTSERETAGGGIWPWLIFGVFPLIGMIIYAVGFFVGWGARKGVHEGKEYAVMGATINAALAVGTVVIVVIGAASF